MDNYEFCVQWILDQSGGDACRVLDYGCGRGEIVKKLRTRGVEAFGCDVFYEGGSYEREMNDALKNGVVKRIDPASGEIPFASGSFDLVVSNQVMEHVENLEAVLAEICRVMKPNGIVLSLFPDKGVWREGHCGIPFLHWFPKESAARIYYAALLRSVGLGHFKGEKNPLVWSRDFCEWLDDWTHYRSAEAIEQIFSGHFTQIVHIEDYWLRKRLGSRTALLPRAVQRLAARKLGGLVFTAKKPCE